jgi:acetate kinase
VDVLVLNCGSSSLKAAVVSAATGEQSFVGLAERLGEPGARLAYVADGEAGEVALDGGRHDAAMTAVLSALSCGGRMDGLAGV